jgi:DNA-binding transcriptional MerR regulator
MVQSQDGDGGLLRIGAVARKAGVSTDTVRYYERRGLLAPAGRLPSGYRLYTPAVVGTIALARWLQGLGMTLDEVADALKAHDRADVTCQSERWRLEAVLDRTRARLAELTGLENRVTDVLGACVAGHCQLRLNPEPA